MPKYMVVVNPIAGKGAGEKLVPEITQTLNDLGLDFSIVVTDQPGHGIELARKAAADYDVVVAAGGDGTANEIINGLMLAGVEGKRKAALGILPIGRGNDFSYGMNLPADWKIAAQVLKDYKKKPLDIGLVTGERYPQGRYFGNGVGIGFDAVVGFVAARSKLTGMLSYLVAAVKTIFLYFNAPTVELTLDDQTLTQPCIMVSIMNGRRMGGSFMMAPQSINDDGKLDLCIVGSLSRMGIIKLFPKVMAGTQAESPAVKTLKTRTIQIRALKGTLPAHADGETLCEEGHELKIELLPGALDFICSDAV